jgi:ubiquinone/menaquinone biosynthesis C-methylase UbiE
MTSAFEERMRSRSAEVYADFLVPHLRDGFHVLDVGCGPGSISLGLAADVSGVRVVGIDPEDDFDAAREYAGGHGIDNVEFRCGDVYRLDFPDDHFDACLCHSMLETLDHPLDGLLEIKRVLKPDGVLGVACVEYGGLILAGPGSGCSTDTPTPIADGSCAACWSVQATNRSSPRRSTTATGRPRT